MIDTANRICVQRTDGPPRGFPKCAGVAGGAEPWSPRETASAIWCDLFPPVQTDTTPAMWWKFSARRWRSWGRLDFA